MTSGFTRLGFLILRRARQVALLPLLVLVPAAVAAQTAEPSSTTATYGSWTVTCATPAASGEAAASEKICQMTISLSVKGTDGQVRPLIEMAIGQPLGGEGPRVVVQVPIDVALREPVVISVDAEGGDGTQTPKPQTELVTASYFACVPTGCIADAAVSADTVAALKTAAATNVTFTALAAAKKITVPVPMTGFVDAWAALGLSAP
jgi:invasion protein IalB